MPDDEQSVVSYYELCSKILNEKSSGNTTKREQIQKRICTYLKSLDLFNVNEQKMKLRVFFNEDDFVCVINNKLQKDDIDKLSEKINIFIEECLKYGEGNRNE